MALIVVATAGGAASNSYITLAEGNSYHEARLHNSDWTGASDATKNASIVWATRTLDSNYLYTGWASGSRDEQALAWPRVGVVDEDGRLLDSDTVPPRVKNATAELAMFLIAADRSALKGAPEGAGIKKVSIYNGLAVEFDFDNLPAEVPTHILTVLDPYASLKQSASKSGPVPVVRT